MCLRTFESPFPEETGLDMARSAHDAFLRLSSASRHLGSHPLFFYVFPHLARSLIPRTIGIFSGFHLVAYQKNIHRQRLRRLVTVCSSGSHSVTRKVRHFPQHTLVLHTNISSEGRCWIFLVHLGLFLSISDSDGMGMEHVDSALDTK